METKLLNTYDEYTRALNDYVLYTTQDESYINGEEVGKIQSRIGYWYRLITMGKAFITKDVYDNVSNQLNF